jgi:hypothetical protein
VPAATTVSVAEPPDAIVGELGLVVIEEAVQGAFTNTVTLPSCEPHGAVTWTQYVVLVTGETTVLLPVAPKIGFDASPRLPRNHWNVNGPLPFVVTEIVDDCPTLIVGGCAPTPPNEIGVQATVTVTAVAGLFDTGAHWPVTFTQ